MKRYEDEDQKSPLVGLAFPIGIYVICLGVYVASAAPAEAPTGAFVSVAAGAPAPLAGTCAASEQQSPHVRSRDDFPPTSFRYRENRAEIIALADAGKFELSYHPSDEKIPTDQTDCIREVSDDE
ncbi:hypothetical protein [Rhizobium sp. 007]|uniref:hypothetical protein n=1 Tax=Rhizobium sp. 007 TaxID=2785056 RepID=UPI00188DEFA0|nr:hypothetical protein [Rhizobium sp. 007]QPB18919.1 hypothetical protein ISN39_15060 [Rhizobium sp. 007]